MLPIVTTLRIRIHLWTLEGTIETWWYENNDEHYCALFISTFIFPYVLLAFVDYVCCLARLFACLFNKKNQDCDIQWFLSSCDSFVVRFCLVRLDLVWPFYHLLLYPFQKKLIQPIYLQNKTCLKLSTKLI